MISAGFAESVVNQFLALQNAGGAGGGGLRLQQPAVSSNGSGAGMNVAGPLNTGPLNAGYEAFMTTSRQAGSSGGLGQGQGGQGGSSSPALGTGQQGQSLPPASWYGMSQRMPLQEGLQQQKQEGLQQQMNAQMNAQGLQQQMNAQGLQSHMNAQGSPAGNYGGQVSSGGGVAQTYGGFGGEGGD